MPLAQFLVIQGLLFGLFITSIYLTGGAQGLVPSIIMNFLTFFSGGWLVTMMVKKRQNLVTTVLAATLSFNLVTYLLGMGLGAKMPPVLQVTGDFFVVTLFSLAGMYARLRLEANKQDGQ